MKQGLKGSGVPGDRRSARSSRSRAGEKSIEQVVFDRSASSTTAGSRRWPMRLVKRV